MNDAHPFVLFDDARPGAGRARLYRNPIEIIVARRLAEVPQTMVRMRAALRAGRCLAGWLGYETGFALEPRLANLAGAAADDLPLIWFGVFENAETADIAAILPDPAGAWLNPPRPRISPEHYGRAFRRAKDYIVAGDIYQVNLSYRADVDAIGHPLALYAQIRSAAEGGWGGVVHTGASWLLSTSPELFFTLKQGVVEARPMKGTAKRDADAARDAEAARRLRGDPKELAENVMIVDLLRNDLSRIARKGSVTTPALFEVETYPTLHTLTSTVRADLRPDRDVIDVIAALFPCGSVTGAPKIRAMEIIDELEGDGRGAYTGSIGWISPDGEAAFNVAIRTLVIPRIGANGVIGLGSGVVFDSTCEGEWAECEAKGAFLTANRPHFELLETMRFEPGEGVRDLDLHLERLRTSASALGFGFEAAHVRRAIEQASIGVTAPARIRLRLAIDGAVSAERQPMPEVSTSALTVALAPSPFDPLDVRVRHKTTLRGPYDDARRAAQTDEVVFIDAEGCVTEGSFTNVFVARDGVLLTPPLSRGLLPGVLRARCLREGRAVEADLRASDLSAGFFVGNALRGLMPARL